MSDDPIEGWTDLHLHPIASDWRPTAAELPSLLERLGITAVGHAVVHAVPDHWDAAEEEPAPVVEVSDPSLEAVGALAARADCVSLNLLCDPVACGYGEFMTKLRAPRDPWRPCVLSVGWGPISIPDARLERTASRFSWSLAIGGPGLPAKPETAARVLPTLDPVTAMVDHLSTLLGTPCAAHLAFSG